MTAIKLYDMFGVEVLSRANARKLYDLIDEETSEIDFEGITFISRSVADELYNMSDRYPAVSFSAMSDEVAKMMDIVGKGRKHRRGKSLAPKVSVTYNCRNIEDLREALM